MKGIICVFISPLSLPTLISRFTSFKNKKNYLFVMMGCFYKGPRVNQKRDELLNSAQRSPNKVNLFPQTFHHGRTPHYPCSLHSTRVQTRRTAVLLSGYYHCRPLSFLNKLYQLLTHSSVLKVLMCS